MTPPTVYRLYWRGDMVCVEIYPTTQQMHQRAKSIGATIDKRIGAYHIFMVGTSRDTKGKCKSIIVACSHGIGTIVHEFTHAALSWFEYRKGWKHVLPQRAKRRGWDTREEQLAGMIGELTRRFACQYWKRRQTPP